MTPEEIKAREIVEKFKKGLTDFRSSDWRRNRIAKQCALICCETIIDSYEKNKHVDSSLIPVYNFWNQVKQSIPKL